MSVLLMHLLALNLAGAPAARPTEHFRAEHVELRTQLAQARAQAGELPGLPPAQQLARARSVVEFFDAHILAHAAWEERALYPLVDKLAGGGPHPFTATMRREHQVVARWTGELREALKAKPLDAAGFARRADNLFGLLDAHFEEEEEVLLPLVDQKLTAAQFEQAMEASGAAHPH